MVALATGDEGDLVEGEEALGDAMEAAEWPWALGDRGFVVYSSSRTGAMKNHRQPATLALADRGSCSLSRAPTSTVRAPQVVSSSWRIPLVGWLFKSVNKVLRAATFASS